MGWINRFALCLAVLMVSVSAPWVGESFAQSVVQPDWAEDENPWCAHPGLSVWAASRPAQNALAQVTLDIACSRGQVVGVRVKAETRCGRMLCTWSFAEVAQANGAVIEAVFFTFSATRTMHIQLAGNAISVDTANDYNQEGRASDTVRARLVLE